MDAVSYPQPEVVEFFDSHLIGLRIPADDPTLGPRFSIKWTPSLLVLDSGGEEHYRTLGFFSGRELIASLLLGMGKTCFDKAQRTQAIKHFERLVGEFPDSPSAPEGLYLAGVARYLETHDVENLKQIYQQLSANYPASPWAMRADPYRLL